MVTQLLEEVTRFHCRAWRSHRYLTTQHWGQRLSSVGLIIELLDLPKYLSPDRCTFAKVILCWVSHIWHPSCIQEFVELFDLPKYLSPDRCTSAKVILYWVSHIWHPSCIQEFA